MLSLVHHFSQTSTLMGLCCWVMTHGGKQRQRAAKAIVGEDSMTRCWRLQERGWDFRWYIVGSVFILFSICNSTRITNVCLCHVLGIYKSWINLQVDLLHIDLSTSSFLNLSLLNFIFDIHGRPFFLLSNSWPPQCTIKSVILAVAICFPREYMLFNKPATHFTFVVPLLGILMLPHVESLLLPRHVHRILTHSNGPFPRWVENIAVSSTLGLQPLCSRHFPQWK